MPTGLFRQVAVDGPRSKSPLASVPFLVPHETSTVAFRIHELLGVGHTVDGRNPATPQKPWTDDSPVNTEEFDRSIWGFCIRCIRSVAVQA